MRTRTIIGAEAAELQERADFIESAIEFFK
jgi:hypothetical protein